MAQEEPTNYQFAGAGLGLQYIADRAYAFSGGVGVPDSLTILLEFDTGSQPLLMSLEVSIVGSGGTKTNDDYLFQNHINEEGMQAWVVDSSASIAMLATPVTFILPPFSHYKLRSYNNTDATENLVYAWMYGKSFGVK